MIRDIRLFCVIASWSIWMGGFAFYFGIVVPTGAAVVGGSEQGFVTQQVTSWLNLMGVVSLLIMLWDAITVRSRLLLATLVIMAICQVYLFAMHYQLDALIDTQARRVLDSTRFRAAHESYEVAATIQWLAGAVHLFGIVRIANRRYT